ncbi:LAMI_0B06238g1_1 [Lachancea mirantina]|uniref:LAMI_0B06238g1_1 n=1 Tax=Lachancea mirantina TaxID=1230905 RepID=A0A1G4IWM6_9SACH|nr:LAMI_0B06238g1_1 [Lachancea mirantina]
MVVLNPNNWHWVDKNTLPWTERYMEKLEIESEKFRILRVEQVSGDSNVSQRKGKVICYFDLNLGFQVEVLEEDQQVSEGRVTVPEFMHDEQDFLIQTEGFGGHSRLVEQDFVPLLRAALCRYQDALIAEHSTDLQQ